MVVGLAGADVLDSAGTFCVLEVAAGAGVEFGAVLDAGVAALCAGKGVGNSCGGGVSPVFGLLHADNDSIKVLTRMISKTFMLPPRLVAEAIIKRPV